MKSHVIFYEVFEEEKIALQKYLPSEWNCSFTPQSIQESGHREAEANVISIRTQSVVPLEWSHTLQGILSRSAGYDHLSSFTKAAHVSVVTGHLYQYSGRAVAEQAAMMWLGLLRKLPLQTKAMNSFSRDGLTGRECLGKTLAVFGVGDIGHHLCEIGTGLGMDVLGVDVIQSHSNVHYVEKDEAIASADIIACSMNLNETNHEYFSQDVMSTCRDKAIFVNVARGEFSRNTTLLHFLESGHLGGVGLDVFYDEPILGPALRENKLIDHPELFALQKLLNRDDVILTPHNAFNTAEAVDRKSQQSVEQLKHFFDTGRFISHASTEKS